MTLLGGCGHVGLPLGLVFANSGLYADVAIHQPVVDIWNLRGQGVVV